MSDENQKADKLEGLAVAALTPTAHDFAGYVPKDGKLPTGIALAGIANLGANKLYSVAEVLDKITSFGTYVAGWKHVEEKILPRVKIKVENIPEEQRQFPPLLIAGPILEGSKYTAEEPILTELFASLLAGAMNSQTSDQIHPSFADIVRQLSAEEAKILKYLGDTSQVVPIVHLRSKLPNRGGYLSVARNFSYLGRLAGNEMSPRIQLQIDSLRRLGLVDVPDGEHITDLTAYTSLETAPELAETIEKIKAAGNTPNFARRYIRLSVMGRRFYEACVKPSEFYAQGKVA